MLNNDKVMGLKLFYAFVSVALFMVGCSNDENAKFEVDTELENRCIAISMEDVPEGVEPLVLKDKAELYELIEKLDNVNLCVTEAPSKAGLVSIRALKDRSERGGIKSIETNLNPGGQTDYTILIQLAYAQRGSGSITVTSTEANTWYFSSWTQTAGTASWLGQSSIQYSIAGDIKMYIMIKLQLFEVRRVNMTVDGTVQI